MARGNWSQIPEGSSQFYSPKYTLLLGLFVLLVNPNQVNLATSRGRIDKYKVHEVVHLYKQRPWFISRRRP